MKNSTYRDDDGNSNISNFSLATVPKPTSAQLIHLIANHYKVKTETAHDWLCSIAVEINEPALVKYEIS